MSGAVHSGAAPLFDISRVTVSGSVHSGLLHYLTSAG